MNTVVHTSSPSETDRENHGESRGLSERKITITASQAYSVKAQLITLPESTVLRNREEWRFVTPDSTGKEVPHTEQVVSQCGENEWQRTGYVMEGKLERTEEILPAFIAAVQKMRELSGGKEKESVVVCGEDSGAVEKEFSFRSAAVSELYSIFEQLLNDADLSDCLVLNFPKDTADEILTEAKVRFGEALIEQNQ